MNYRIVLNYLGKILLLESICMLPSLIIAICAGENASFEAFLVTMLLQLAAGTVILIFCKPKNNSIYAREGSVIVALAWILISLFGALPFLLSGTVNSYIDALFETVSGFTTTGATILNDIEAAPMSLLYWRSFTHWLGGMGVLVFILAIAPFVRGNGMSLHILRAESPGPTVGKLAPKLRSTARILYSIYIVLTASEFILLLFGDMPVFDALTTAFSTAGTGGFSIKNNSMMAYSTYCQTVVSIFMMLFGINFSMYFLLLVGDIKSILKNTELRTYLLIIVIATVLITMQTTDMFNSVGESAHHAFFQVSSIITTTGMISCDYEIWPEFTHGILLILMFIGASAGSTGGGIKVSRLIILVKSLFFEIRKSLFPHSVKVMTVDGEVIDKNAAGRCCIFFATHIMLTILSTLLVSLDGYSFETNLTAVIACINNIGPGFDLSGPTESLSFFSPVSKLILSFNMLAGRLELFPVLVLFAPQTWQTKK